MWGTRLIPKEIAGSTVLVTGGTGSFGKTMVKKLLQSDVGEVRVFSRDEEKQDAMRQQMDDDRVKFFIGDTRDYQSIVRATKSANFIFHAAALKQVPSAEFFPLEAVKTNILGSDNVLRAALENSADSVVCLSTDKAVYPINAMGMSKAIMEKCAIAMARENQAGNTRINVTRYGNVMFSRGSVIPRVISQIKSGSPITVTNGEMTRFLMTLDESVDLVLHAFMSNTSGSIFVKKAPAATVFDLIQAIKILFSAEKHEVSEIGVRHGEKLYESLLGEEEASLCVDEGDYFSVPLDKRGLDYRPFFTQGSRQLRIPQAYTSHNTERLDVEAVIKKLLEIPEVRGEL